MDIKPYLLKTLDFQRRFSAVSCDNFDLKLITAMRWLGHVHWMLDDGW